MAADKIQSLTALGSILMNHDRPMIPIKMLIEATFHPFEPPHYIVGPNGLSVLHAAIIAHSWPHTGVTDSVLSYILSQYSRHYHFESCWGEYGLTPLMTAAASGDFRATELLIMAGAPSMKPPLSGDKCMALYSPYLAAFQATFDPKTMTSARRPFADPDGINRCIALITEAGLNSITYTEEPQEDSLVSFDTKGEPSKIEYPRESNIDSSLGKIDVAVETETPSDSHLVVLKDIFKCRQVSSILQNQLHGPLEPGRSRLSFRWGALPDTISGRFIKRPFLVLGDIPYQSCLHLCRDLATCLDTIHKRGFTHGSLDLDHMPLHGLLAFEIPEGVESLEGTLLSVKAEILPYRGAIKAENGPVRLLYVKPDQRLRFQSPELHFRSRVSTMTLEDLKKIDVYALGIMMLHLLDSSLDGDSSVMVASDSASAQAEAVEHALGNVWMRSVDSATAELTTYRLIPALRELLRENPEDRSSDISPIINVLETMDELEPGEFALVVHSSGAYNIWTQERDSAGNVLEVQLESGDEELSENETSENETAVGGLEVGVEEVEEVEEASDLEAGR
ncbi:hypothetical protein B0T17DRAFT_133969 [Bombardia bombarda]|uniref:Protein kinase domain-containing protein n=1 Tax=Bombardia bombarda TaxID=252184 RepID=A0AA39TQP7_9PEZI|nr:hypothetical protein B0T17DRAFT_133969 [Bombardia bombarda]